MIWDGMGFFSTSGYHKLKRMVNSDIKVNWYDKYLTPQGFIIGMMYLISILAVLIWETRKYNTVMSTKADLVEEKIY